MTTCARPAAAIGIGRGGGIGSGYGQGIGSGFGGFIGELRRKGLDVVIVIDGTGSMQLIIDDVKARWRQLVQAIHRLVPIARIGVVVFGGKGEQMDIQPLTPQPAKADRLPQQRPGRRRRRMGRRLAGGVKTAIDNMDWKPYAKKVIVLVGDSPPKKDDFEPLIARSVSSTPKTEPSIRSTSRRRSTSASSASSGSRCIARSRQDLAAAGVLSADPGGV